MVQGFLDLLQLDEAGFGLIENINYFFSQSFEFLFGVCIGMRGMGLGIGLIEVLGFVVALEEGPESVEDDVEEVDKGAGVLEDVIILNNVGGDKVGFPADMLLVVFSIALARF